ncbi:MAG: ABC transporter ATP-binding protein [Actinobacteria bacterium]|nr:ABC transporter ATP-binding protein [Actinomycetota bacterium]
MSTETQTADENKPVVANERPKFGPGNHRGPMAHGPMGGGTGEKAMSFGPSLKRLIGYLGPQKVAVGVVILMAAVGVTFNVLGPKVLGKATDVIFAGVVGKQLPAGVPVQTVIDGLRARGQGNLADMLTSMHVVPGQGILFDDLFRWLMLAVGLYAIGAVLMWANGWILNGVVQKTVYEMRRQVATKLERLPLSYFDKQPRGELLSRVTNDIDNVSQSLQQTLSQLLTSLLTVIGVLIMMLTVSPILTVIAVVSIPVSVGLVAVIGKQSQKRFAAMWKHTGELNGQIEEAFTGHALVKVFGRQREMNTTFHEKNAELYKAAFGAQFISAIIMPVMFFVGNLSYVLVAVVGGLRVASGQLSLGDVQAFITYSRQFTQPLTQIASMANLLQSGVASAERVFEVLDAQEMSAESTGRLPEPVQGRVSFENLDFSYVPDRPLIENLNLDVQPGQTVAIVGPTGAGKTTLVNLVMRFYELNAGRITLDGVDISSIPRADLRSNLGMVLQDTWLFHGTIQDNIAYGRPEASDEEIRAAARATYVDRFVHALPDGYDTVIDEEGSNVSVGEKQLITIARAFLADPALLILDEATSSVDTRTEVLVQKAMGALRKGRTSFVIAHRLSTIRDADVILVMEHGQIVEQGDHAGLLAARGAYYDLYQSQFSGATTAEEEALPQLAGAGGGGARGARRS